MNRWGHVAKWQNFHDLGQRSPLLHYLQHTKVKNYKELVRVSRVQKEIKSKGTCLEQPEALNTKKTTPELRFLISAVADCLLVEMADLHSLLPCFH
jgi:hypothetical protein